jgi:hypothetical protein
VSKDPAEMTPEEYRAWNAERWRVMEAWQHESTMNMTALERLECLAMLVESADFPPQSDARIENEMHNRALWSEYRERWFAKHPAE